MELVQDLVLTALIALLFSYLIAKLVSFAMSGAGDSASASVVEDLKDADDEVIMEELQFGAKMNVGILENQHRVESVQQETVEKVDQFEEVVGPREDDLVEETVIESAPLSDNVIVQSEESNVVGKESEDGVASDDDDDWEGIERSELENVFATAVKFVEVSESGNKKDDALSDVQMELYALHKIATEGPCRDPQPMPLMLSARSKWNAWQKLGNMNPEEAMERYVALLSDRVPDWKEENYHVNDKLESEETVKPDAVAPSDTGSFTGDQTDHTHERWSLELPSGSEGSDLTAASSTVTTAKE
ncbi:acyl-CoA-binding domain-containing protein 3-like isoform X1 [Citrus sinensis]|uniref:acyl-CoA-binding domain-containing protein 3-like isoform X1 n=1 Tax=Citrus sinensis TaxID=2711 RepID=UPI000CECED8A|nr:acyl-CoA-binding domain-containing protein 3-like isoform X1 [Citrus sinensis]XP_024039776.1 acyl-CoA-binding domain-containing protein 3 isoform X1 [Citrus x clementina]